MDHKEKALTGKDNKRSTTGRSTNDEYTAAWQDSESKYSKDLVNKPSIENVINAKEWVDNGSKL